MCVCVRAQNAPLSLVVEASTFSKKYFLDWIRGAVFSPTPGLNVVIEELEYGAYQPHSCDQCLLTWADSKLVELSREVKWHPVAAHKTEGPSYQLTFLGIQIDTSRMELSLPPDKLSRIAATVCEWRGKKAATRRQLQSLIGTLSHAATVVIPGWAFLRRMIDTMKIPRCQHHHVRLNQDFQSDLQWWACFLPGWNGRSILPTPQVAHTFLV